MKTDSTSQTTNHPIFLKFNSYDNEQSTDKFKHAQITSPGRSRAIYPGHFIVFQPPLFLVGLPTIYSSTRHFNGGVYPQYPNRVAHIQLLSPQGSRRVDIRNWNMDGSTSTTISRDNHFRPCRNGPDLWLWIKISR